MSHQFFEDAYVYPLLDWITTLEFSRDSSPGVFAFSLQRAVPGTDSLVNHPEY